MRGGRDPCTGPPSHCLLVSQSVAARDFFCKFRCLFRGLVAAVGRVSLRIAWAQRLFGCARPPARRIAAPGGTSSFGASFDTSLIVALCLTPITLGTYRHPDPNLRPTKCGPRVGAPALGSDTDQIGRGFGHPNHLRPARTEGWPTVAVAIGYAALGNPDLVANTPEPAPSRYPQQSATAMPLNLFLTFDVESNRPGNYITCEHVPGAPGIYWIMDELERHGLRGVFFVNVYEHTRYPDGWIRDLLRQIDARGHEVGLHCHLNPDLDFYRQNLTQYDLEGQTRIIRYGVEFIEVATGRRPVSFRSGALRMNRDTFTALGHCGITVDSSLQYVQTKNNYNDIHEYLSLNRSAQYGAVAEFPITVLARDNRKRARLDPNSTPDARGLIAAVEQMVGAGCKYAVFVAHSFSFVLCTNNVAAAIPGTEVFMKNRKFPNYVMGEDLMLKSVFTSFLDFLKEESRLIRSSLFRESVAADGATTASGVDFVPRVPFNGLHEWPMAEDYVKQRKTAIRLRCPTYRTAPKRLVLHVGTWKTGSKSLQKFWALNQEELIRQQIFYPLNPNAPYMQGGNQSYQSLIATSGDPNREVRLRALAEEIFSNDHHTCLVSHENICNLAIPELLKFVACLSGCRFKIALYLRRQDHYAASLYNQHVKAGVAFPGSFDEHFEQYRSRYDYRQMVERLGTVFGLDNIVVRPYEKEAFFGGTIFSDFSHHVLGMAIDEKFVVPKRDQNSRLDRDALEFKRIVNRLEGTKEEIQSLGKHLIGYCETRDPGIREAFQEHNLLSPGQRARILEACAESNAWVAREMLSRDDGTLFYEPMPSEEDGWVPYRGLDGEKAVEIAFSVYREILHELKGRDAEIERLKAGRRPAAKPKRGPDRGKVSLTRTIKQICKRQFRHGKAIVSRMGARPRPGYPK
jgi:peptidoglycan/xylan/chitin deacetylase (PgdA/CDA1 family)